MMITLIFSTNVAENTGNVDDGDSDVAATDDEDDYDDDDNYADDEQDDDNDDDNVDGYADDNDGCNNGEDGDADETTSKYQFHLLELWYRFKDGQRIILWELKHFDVILRQLRHGKKQATKLFDQGEIIHLQ